METYATGWNAISSKVKISKNDTLFSNGWPVAKVSLDSAVTSTTLFGRTYVYKACSVASCTPGNNEVDIYVRATVYIYTNNATTNILKNATAVH